MFAPHNFQINWIKRLMCDVIFSCVAATKLQFLLRCRMRTKQQSNSYVVHIICVVCRCDFYSEMNDICSENMDVGWRMPHIVNVHTISEFRRTYTSKKKKNFSTETEQFFFFLFFCHVAAALYRFAASAFLLLLLSLNHPIIISLSFFSLSFECDKLQTDPMLAVWLDWNIWKKKKNWREKEIYKKKTVSASVWLEMNWKSVGLCFGLCFP